MENTSGGASPSPPISNAGQNRGIGLVGKIKRTLHERKAKKEKESSTDRAARITAAATVWIAAFTVVMALVGLGTLYEIVTGGQDTHDLAVHAKEQADKMKDMSDAADKIRQAAEGMVAQEKRLADDTEITLKASSKQSRDALDASIAASRLEQRPWLGSADWTFDISESGPIKGNVIISNYGKSPAISITCRIGGGNFLSSHALTKADIAYLDSTPVIRQGTLFPSQSFPLTGIGTAITPDVQKTWFQNIQSGDWVQYFWGYAAYDDTFKRHHRTRFCIAYAPKTKGGIPCSVYNDADDTKKKAN